MSAFHEVRFPVSVSFRSSGGPVRRTEIVTLESGFEERNSPWQHARRSYDAGIGVRSLADIEKVLHFFEARNGQLHGFRWKDFTDFRSAATSNDISSLDQVLGTGDGVAAVFQLQKTYETGTYSYTRPIAKPVTGSVVVAVAGAEQIEGTDFLLDETTGELTFLAASLPGQGQSVTAGFMFDVPVRFDTEQLAITLETFASGAIVSIPVVEIR
ncbi:Gene Transfer Agent (GTA) ORFG12 [hydrothermal vent metagenome]|uniref:Gene Transfer Agent (GTA) ORFG12 n=1 Tax=hydrothermal vent metagenome TaxID=652676 RepID=A0A3B0S7A6_9ZZZZ